MKLRIKAVPGAKNTEISGWLGDVLKIRIAAQPQGGKANQALIGYLADFFSIARSNIVLTAGHTSSVKTIELRDIDEHTVRRRISDAI